MPLKLGQTVFVLDVRNSDNFDKHVKTEITKIGRKYYTVAYKQIEFYINDNTQKENDYSHTWKAYFSEDEHIDEKDADLLYEKIRSFFEKYSKNHKKITLEQLRRVAEILNIEK